MLDVIIFLFELEYPWNEGLIILPIDDLPNDCIVLALELTQIETLAADKVFV